MSLLGDLVESRREVSVETKVFLWVSLLDDHRMKNQFEDRQMKDHLEDRHTKDYVDRLRMIVWVLVVEADQMKVLRDEDRQMKGYVDRLQTIA